MTTALRLPAEAGLSALVLPHGVDVRAAWARSKVLHEQRTIVAMAIVMSVLVIVSALVAAYTLRERTRREWADQLSTMSLMMAEQVSQTLFSAHAVLDGIAERIGAARPDSEEAFRRLAGTREMHGVLVAATSTNPIIEVAALVASSGQVLSNTRVHPVPAINVAERDYFRAYGADPGLGTYVSQPMRSTGDGQWVFVVTRPVRDGQGRLLGLILVSVSLDWVYQFYERVGASLGAGASLSLWRKDFTLMTRWPRVDSQVGEQMHNTGTYRIVGEQRRDHGVLIVEAPREFDVATQVTRMAAPRVVPRYPFIVTPSITEEFYLANWRLSAAWIGLAALICLGLIGVGSRSLLRADSQLRRELNDRMVAQDSLRTAHEQLETRVAERTADLRYEISQREQAQQALARLNEHIAAVSHRAGMAEVVNSVLHNVGNVLNSVNVSVTLIGDQLRQTALADLPRAVALLQAHEHDLADYLGRDPQGRQLFDFLGLLSAQWQHEHRALTDESAQLAANVQHIKDIVSRQQSLSGLSGLIATLDLPGLIDEVLALHDAALKRGGLLVQRDHRGPTQWRGDRCKLTQILLNLVVNAEEAMAAQPRADEPHRLILRSRVTAQQRLEIEVQDSGTGIAPDTLARLFTYGYTTKPTGHGFGLHASAIAAQEMGGSLTAHSDGPGRGATFVLSLPDAASSRTST